MTMNLNIKNLLPRSLMGRSLLILVVPILLVQIIAMTVFFDRLWHTIVTRMSYAVAGEIAMIVKTLEEPSAQDKKFGPLKTFAAQNLGLLLSYEQDAKLNIPAQSYQPPFLEIGAVRALEDELRLRLDRPFVVGAQFDEKWIQIDIEMSGGILHVMVPERRFYTSSGYVFLLWLGGSSILLVGIAILFMRNQIRPIRKLAAAASRFGKGREAGSFKPEGAAEVRQAGRAFLDMQTRIKRQVEARTAMLAGVSHDLRTPLTRMKLQLAMMNGGPDADAMKNDITDMERMIAAYLDFVRGSEGEEIVPANLKAILQKISDAASRQNINIAAFDCPPDIEIPLRPLAFERAVTNLIANAGHYGGDVWITVRRMDETAQIIIDDNGPGIPAARREDVFKPFFRLEESRNAQTGGTGLGLAIAQDIIHGHGGTIDLDDAPQGGLRVRIEIPV